MYAKCCDMTSVLPSLGGYMSTTDARTYFTTHVFWVSAGLPHCLPIQVSGLAAM